MRIGRLWSIPFVAFLFAAACSSSGSGASSNQADCANVCPQAMLAKCSHGPPTESDCETGCAQIRAGHCGSEWDALFTCGGGTAQYTCDSNGEVSVVGCKAQSDALYACLGVEGADAGANMDANTSD